MPNSKQYRRLKHKKEEYKFFIRTKSRADLEQKMLFDINKYVDISSKYKIKGHTKDNDIKKVECSVAILSKSDAGYFVNLKLHIHHYSYVLFNFNQYLVNLNSILDLEPGSILLHKPEETKPQPEPEPRRTSAFI